MIDPTSDAHRVLLHRARLDAAPGGVLGVEQHRAAKRGLQYPVAADGYAAPGVAGAAGALFGWLLLTLAVMLAVAEGRLAELPAPAFSDDPALTVVMAAAGYPGTPRAGGAIQAIDAAEALRSELIGRLDLQVVANTPVKLN